MATAPAPPLLPTVIRVSHETGELDHFVEITPGIEDEWILGSWMLPNGELIVISKAFTFDPGGPPIGV